MAMTVTMWYKWGEDTWYLILIIVSVVIVDMKTPELFGMFIPAAAAGVFVSLGCMQTAFDGHIFTCHERRQTSWAQTGNYLCEEVSTDKYTQ